MYIYIYIYIYILINMVPKRWHEENDAFQENRFDVIFPF